MPRSHEKKVPVKMSKAMLWIQGCAIAIIMGIAIKSAAAGSPCPSRNSILPCTCKRMRNMTLVTCDNSNANNILKAIEAMSKHRMTIDIFSIISEGFTQFPPILFRNNKVIQVDIQTPELIKINQRAFLGQEYHLKSLKFRSSMLDALPVDSLVNLYSLRTFQMLWSPKLNSISGNQFNRMKSPSSIEVLKIINSNITHIGNGAFAELTGLKVLDLSNNRLTTISGQYFQTNGMDKLTQASFGNNRIRDVTADFLKIFPKHASINLGHNHISTISDASLLTIVHNNLKIDLQGNFIDCNCKMKYVGNLNSYINYELSIKGSCKFPPSKSTIKLSDLKPINFAECYTYRSARVNPIRFPKNFNLSISKGV